MSTATAAPATTLRDALGAAPRLNEFLRRTLDEDRRAARLSPAFKAFYGVRPLLPIAARQLLQLVRNRSKSQPEDWFIPGGLLSELDGLDRPLASPWPGGAEFAFVLTHDVETRQGVELIPQLAAVEEQLGFRSCWNIVPYKYKTDPGLLDDLRSRGHEIGVHGYNHDGRLFFSRRVFRQRAAHINRAIDRLGAVGFRAPMVHRNLEWMQQLNIEHDSSCFDIDPFQAMPGGVQSFWPFVYGRFVELPYTLPQDHTLLVTLGEKTDRIWREKLATIHRSRGMALALTHPDYLDTPERLAIYRGFLEHVRETYKPWTALPREVAKAVRKEASASG